VETFYAPSDSVLTTDLHMNITALGNRICFLYWLAEASSVSATLSVGGNYFSLPVRVSFLKFVNINLLCRPPTWAGILFHWTLRKGRN